MIFSENRYPPIGSWPEGMLFRIMLWQMNPRASEFTRVWDPCGAYFHHHRSASQAYR